MPREETSTKRERGPVGSEALATPTGAHLSALRDTIFRRLKNEDLDGFPGDLGRYAATLRQLLELAQEDLPEQARLESDHRMFFEQIKAVLVTNRIQLRMELERVRASRRYGREGSGPSRPVWEG